MTQTPELTTNLMRAINELLRIKEGVSLAEWLAAQRKHGSTYVTIAQDLYAATGDTVSISFETVRSYCHELGVEPMEVAS